MEIEFNIRDRCFEAHTINSQFDRAQLDVARKMVHLKAFTFLERKAIHPSHDGVVVYTDVLDQQVNI